MILSSTQTTQWFKRHNLVRKTNRQMNPKAIRKLINWIERWQKWRSFLETPDSLHLFKTRKILTNYSIWILITTKMSSIWMSNQILIWIITMPVLTLIPLASTIWTKSKIYVKSRRDCYHSLSNHKILSKDIRNASQRSLKRMNRVSLTNFKGSLTKAKMVLKDMPNC